MPIKRAVFVGRVVSRSAPKYSKMSLRSLDGQLCPSHTKISFKLGAKDMPCTKEDLIKRRASGNYFWTCGEVVTLAAHMGREPVTIQGIAHQVPFTVNYGIIMGWDLQCITPFSDSI